MQGNSLTSQEHKSVIRILRVAKVAKVIMEFDGSGDSGSIDYCTFLDSLDDVVTPRLDTNSLSAREVAQLRALGDLNHDNISDRCRDLGYAVLSCGWAGWENNDGAYGTITIDVAMGNVDVVINNRYTDVNTESSNFDILPPVTAAEGT